VGPHVTTVAGLLDRRLLVVTGKGGVGKSTVAAAIGMLAARNGRRTAVVEVAARDDISRMLGGGPADVFRERVLVDGLAHVTVDPEHALQEYLVDQLPVRAMADVLTSSRAFAYLAAATPGLRELLTVGKVWELAQPTRRTPGARPYDLVVLDAPATGHGIALLAAPRTFADAARVGPIARQGRMISEMLLDPRATAVLAVSTAEELPITETIGLRAAARAATGSDLALAIVNGLRPDRFSTAEVAVLEGAGGAPAAAALRSHRHAKAQRSQLARLRRAFHGHVPVVTLPFCGDGVVDRDDVDQLARQLGRKLDA
jgi:anion-transporting  ArsA/GET3 family ATPase